jgi:hypothetical protein
MLNIRRSITHRKILIINSYNYRREFSSKSLQERNVMVDDVSRLNSSRVDRIFQVRSVDDVQHVISQARNNQKQVSVRGQSHTMGGHSIAGNNGYQIDMKYMKKMEYDPIQSTVSRGWSNLGRCSKVFESVWNGSNDYAIILFIFCRWNNCCECSWCHI